MVPFWEYCLALIHLFYKWYGVYGNLIKYVGTEDTRGNYVSTHTKLQIT